MYMKISPFYYFVCNRFEHIIIKIKNRLNRKKQWIWSERTKIFDQINRKNRLNRKPVNRNPSIIKDRKFEGTERLDGLNRKNWLNRNRFNLISLYINALYNLNKKNKCKNTLVSFNEPSLTYFVGKMK